MGGPRLIVGGGGITRRHLGDKLHELARLDHRALKDIEMLVDWKLARLANPPPLRVKHLRRKAAS